MQSCLLSFIDLSYLLSPSKDLVSILFYVITKPLGCITKLIQYIQEITSHISDIFQQILNTKVFFKQKLVIQRNSVSMTLTLEMPMERNERKEVGFINAHNLKIYICNKMFWENKIA